jgi:HEXXH motif-containing protein
LFLAVASGGGGLAAAQELAAAERSKTMLMLRYLVVLVEETGHQHAAAIRAAYQTLSRIHRLAPHAVEALLRQPAVGAWATETVRGLSGPSTDGASPGRLVVLTAAAAIRARYPYQARVPLADGVLVIPSLGHAVLDDVADGEEAVINVTEDGAEVCAASSRVVIPNSLENTFKWRSLPVLTATADGVRFQAIVDDVDPYRFAHHPLSGGQLTASDLRSWHVVVSKAWQILVQHHRSVADELRTMIVALTPLERQNRLIGRSATAPDSFGCVALSEPTSALPLAITLVHELQHSKLAALLDLVDLVRPDSGARFYAPWRDDPRPAYALLHGAYAYLGVATFCRQQRHLSSADEAVSVHRDYVRWRDAVSDSTCVLLASGELTGLGRQFTESMLAAVDGWHGDCVPAVAQRLARVSAESHRSRWREDHVGEVSKSQSSR